MNTQPDSPVEAEIDELGKILDKFIVFGQKQEPFICARCHDGTDDKSQRFCWCTDRDSSNRADSPTWINNINYPRYEEAKGKAIQSINHLIKAEVVKELEGIQLMRSWELEDKEFAKYLCDAIEALKQEMDREN